MKQFACGDAFPGCGRVFLGNDEQILGDVIAHARADHGLTSVPDSLLAAVRGSMTVPV